jgi:Polysaccharide biosynthesis/export protein
MRLSASSSALRCLGALGAVAALAGCGSLGMGREPLPPAPVSASNADYNYVIGAGDSLNIIVWRNPELSLSVPVRPDGKLSAPLVDELVVQGKTSTEVARDIEKKLATFVRDPVVTVIVTSFVGPYSEQIRVVGEAARPQFLPFKQKMTLLDCGRPDRLCRWQRRDHPAQRRRQQAVLGPPEGPHQARRCLGQCRDAAGRHPDHSAELLLTPPARPDRGCAGCPSPQARPAEA